MIPLFRRLKDHRLRNQFKDLAGDLAADLVSDFRNNKPFLNALFETEAGLWALASELCPDELTEYQERISDVEQLADQIDGIPGNNWLLVCWQYLPNDEDYCTISCFMHPYMWNSVAILNKAWFFER